MMQTKVQEALEGFLKKRFPEAIEEFEVILKPVGGAEINSQHVQNLVNSIYYVFLQTHTDSCTRLYSLVRQFAKAFKEDEYVKRLDDIWSGKATKENLIIPTIEIILIRDMSNPFYKVNQKYNLGHGPVYTLGELNLRMQFSKRKIFDMFNEIYLKHDLQVPFNLAIHQNTVGDGAFPSL